MNIAVNVAIVLGSCIAMEFVAWAVHKYIMHSSWGWSWHKTHHEDHGHTLEKNDLYGIGFAVIAICLMLISHIVFGWLYWVGVGMCLYGLLYAVVHDGMAHGRLGFSAKPRRGYLKRLVQAHRMHHVIKGPDDGVSFGFLYAPPIRKLKVRAALSLKKTRGSQHLSA
jgi:beta-carotene 3-hydroxylase